MRWLGMSDYDLFSFFLLSADICFFLSRQGYRFAGGFSFQNSRVVLVLLQHIPKQS
jgi:hypothetical protein